MSTVTEPRLLGIAQVAAILGVSPGRIRYLVRAGVLPSVRLGGTGYHRFRREDIDKILSGGR